MKKKNVKIGFVLSSADSSDIEKVLVSKEYATVAGKPVQHVDYVITVNQKTGELVMATLDRIVRYEPFVSKHWTTGKNPKGTDWKSLYMFDSVVRLSLPVLSKFSNIMETKVNKIGVEGLSKFQQNGTYIEIYL